MFTLLQPLLCLLPSATWDSGEIIFLKIAAIFFLVLLNGLFVASEFAIVKIRPSQLEALLEEKTPQAARARHIISHLDAYLSATQLGITLASLGLGWIGEPFLNSLFTPLLFSVGITSEKIIASCSFAVAFTLITFLHIVLGEQSPKTFAIRKPIQTTLWLSPLLTAFYLLFRPAIALLNGASNALLRHVFRLEPANETELFHSEEEVRLILGESTKTDEITPLGQKLALNAFDLRHRVVRDIMTPRSEVITFDLTKDFEEEIAKVVASQHTRFPICSGELDEASGLVHIKDLLACIVAPSNKEKRFSQSESLPSREQESIPSNREELRAIQRSLLHVSEMMSLEKLLNFFLSQHAHLAIVVDEYGGAVGIVTLDNVLEELVGSIQDEFDTAEEELRHISDQEFEVVGSFALHDLSEIIHLKLEETDVSTIAGYVTQLLDHLPQRGEQVLIGDYCVTVKESDGRRVLKLHFKISNHGIPPKILPNINTESHPQTLPGNGSL
ncbi:MAG: hemolysin family protein [Verrucomicrobiae bacterium]|nr:hemolysin family protein [Verrucomicrobiae bacterium]